MLAKEHSLAAFHWKPDISQLSSESAALARPHLGGLQQWYAEAVQSPLKQAHAF
jgi:hypothetical protein